MKITKTYSIEQDLYIKFDDITRKKNINKSQFIEDKIREYVTENIELDFSSKYEYNGIVVTIKDKKVNNNGQLLLVLDDESIINYDLFKKHYTKIVNPDSFFNDNDALLRKKTVNIKTELDALSIPLLIDAENNKIALTQKGFQYSKNLLDIEKDKYLIDEILQIGYEKNIHTTNNKDFIKGSNYVNGLKWVSVVFDINEDINKSLSREEYYLVAIANIVGKKVIIKVVKNTDTTLRLEISGSAIEYLFDKNKNIQEESAISFEPFEYFEININDLRTFLWKYLMTLGQIIDNSNKESDTELLEKISEVTNKKSSIYSDELLKQVAEKYNVNLADDEMKDLSESLSYVNEIHQSDVKDYRELQIDELNNLIDKKRK